MNKDAIKEVAYQKINDARVHALDQTIREAISDAVNDAHSLGRESAGDDVNDAHSLGRESAGDDVTDYTDKFGKLNSGAEWPMYSYERAAWTFWNGVANALRDRGMTDDEIGVVLASKYARWLLDGEGDRLEALGREMGADLTKIWEQS